MLQGVPGLFLGALTDAAVNWNGACGQLPILNDQPVLVATDSSFTLPPGLEHVVSIDVRYFEGVAPSAPECEYFPGELCYPVARTTFSQDSASVVIYSRSGRGGLRWTLHDFRGVYDRIFDHELGHVLLLGHDICTDSVMNEGLANRFDCAPSQLDCEPRPRREHCDQMAISFEPADPLNKVLDHPDALCSLNLYCHPYLGGMVPWSKIRSGCVWFHDVAQTFVDTYDQDGQHIGSSVRSYNTFRCYGGGSLNLGPDLVSSSSPFLMVGFPKPGAVAQGGMLKVTGWTWARGQSLLELRFFVDQEDAAFLDFNFPVHSPQICALDFDVPYCNPNGSFTGHLDIRQLPAGRHKLAVVATDTSSDPLPSSIEIEFVVPEVFVNSPPSPQDDEATATMIEGVGQAIVIDVLANDFDVDGQPITLAAKAVLAFPTQGVLSQLESGHFSYLPFPWASGSDSFRYRIVDNMGASGNAEVRIQLMEAIILE